MKKNFPPVALGTWSWGSGMVGGDQVFGNHISNKQLSEVFDAAIKSGLNLWDSATAYAMGESENILGSFTSRLNREDIIISTKFTPQIAADADNAVSLMAEESMKRFKTDYIDIYWIHNPQDVERWTPQLLPLLKSGKVKYVGMSNHSLSELKRAEEILAAEGYHISAVQNHYSLLYRESEQAGIIDYCREHGMIFFAYMVLEQGALSGKYDTKNPLPADSMRGQTYNPQLDRIETLVSALRHVATAHQASVSQINIAWAIAKNTLPIIGATKVNQVEEAAQAANIVLTGEEIKLLEEAAAKTGAETRGSWEQSMIE